LPQVFLYTLKSSENAHHAGAVRQLVGLMNAYRSSGIQITVEAGLYYFPGSILVSAPLGPLLVQLSLLLLGSSSDAMRGSATGCCLTTLHIAHIIPNIRLVSKLSSILL
jgi:hypothetical protein